MIRLYSRDGKLKNADSRLCACGIYAHGELEDILGHDVIYVPHTGVDDAINFVIPFKECGIFDIEIIHKTEVLKAKLYFWFNIENPKSSHKTQCGLCVLQSDKESVKYAAECLNKKKFYIVKCLITNFINLL